MYTLVYLLFKCVTIPQPGVLTKTIVATKERLEGVGGREGGEGGEDVPGTITPAQRKREMEVVKKEVSLFSHITYNSLRFSHLCLY